MASCSQCHSRLLRMPKVEVGIDVQSLLEGCGCFLVATQLRLDHAEVIRHESILGSQPHGPFAGSQCLLITSILEQNPSECVESPNVASLVRMLPDNLEGLAKFPIMVGIKQSRGRLR